MKNKKTAYIIFITVIILFFVYTIVYNCTHTYSADQGKADEMKYVKGKVQKVLENNLFDDSSKEGGQIGQQQVLVKILRGKHRGEEIEMTNYVSSTHHILLHKGDTVLVGINENEYTDLGPSFHIFQYYRPTAIYILIAFFLLIIVIIGRKKGIMTILSLSLALYTILAFTLPLIYHGSSPVYIAIMSAIFITVTTLVFLNGISRKTLVAIASTLSGVVLSGVIYGIFSYFTHMNGYNFNDADTLVAIHLSHGLKPQNVLFCIVLIAALGAVMDVAMSITSAIYEMIQISEGVGRKRLFIAGMNIGKDMIGTMANTLILAFVGGSFVSLIVIAANSMQFAQLLSTDTIVMEILQGIACTSGVVLTVPITSFIAVEVLYKEKKENVGADESAP